MDVRARRAARALARARATRPRCPPRSRRPASPAALALLAVTVDETDEAFANIYSAAVSLQNVLPGVPQRLLVVAAARSRRSARSRSSCANYEAFLLLLGSFFVPLFGVLLADWLLAGMRYTTARRLRRARVPPRAGRRLARRLRALPVAAPDRARLVDRPRRADERGRARDRRDAAELRARLRARGRRWRALARRARPPCARGSRVRPLGRGRKPRDRPIEGGPPAAGRRRRSTRRARCGCWRGRPSWSRRCAEADRARLLPPLAALGLPVTCLDGSRDRRRSRSATRATYAIRGRVRRATAGRAEEARSLRRRPARRRAVAARGAAAPLGVPGRDARRAGGRTAALLRRPGPRPRARSRARSCSTPTSTPRCSSTSRSSSSPRRRRSRRPGRSSRRRSPRSASPRCSSRSGRGARSSSPTGRLTAIRAQPVLDADPTGAGDAFAAAYLASRSSGLAPARRRPPRATSLVGTLLAGGAPVKRARPDADGVLTIDLETRECSSSRPARASSRRRTSRSRCPSSSPASPPARP